MDKINICKNCANFKECRDTTESWIFLFIGLIATIAIRLVNLVIGVSALWAKILWYIGVIGFLLYFLYKFRGDMRIKNRLKLSQIDAKIMAQKPLSDEDYLLIKTLLCGLRSKKDTINYFFIFFTSAVALILGIIQDLLLK